VGPGDSDEFGSSWAGKYSCVSDVPSGKSQEIFQWHDSIVSDVHDEQRMSTTEVGNGLVLPYAAMTVAGSGGAAAIVLITFMAVTSTLSAQVIAVSSIISFDMYREYFNKSATDHQIIRWSHFGVVFFALFAAAFSTMLFYVGADLNWTLYMLGRFGAARGRDSSSSVAR
jgi:Na+/proline symporter